MASVWRRDSGTGFVTSMPSLSDDRIMSLVRQYESPAFPTLDVVVTSDRRIAVFIMGVNYSGDMRWEIWRRYD